MNRKAFSLIEISVVLIIISFIITIIVGAKSLISNANITRAISVTKNFMISEEFNRTNIGLWFETSMPNSFNYSSDNSDNIEIWKSLSISFNGSFHEASQVLSKWQPKYKKNVINGLPGIKFDGSNDFLLISNGKIYSKNPHTIFVVIKPDKTSSTRSFLAFNIKDTDNSNTECYFLNGSTGRIVHDDGDSTLFNGNDLKGRNSIISLVLTNSNISLYINGQFIETVLNSLKSADSLSIGQEYDKNLSRGNFWDGYIGEIMIYDKALSDTERSVVEAYLLKKWKILNE